MADTGVPAATETTSVPGTQVRRNLGAHLAR